MCLRGRKGLASGQAEGAPEPAIINLPSDGVGHADIYGMLVDFEGFAPYGGLRYRITTPMPDPRIFAWSLLTRYVTLPVL